MLVLTTDAFIVCSSHLRTAANWNRFTRDHGIEKDESEYLAAFSEEIVVTADVPKWLWNGIRILKHPTMIIHQPDQELAVASNNDGAGGTARYALALRIGTLSNKTLVARVCRYNRATAAVA